MQEKAKQVGFEWENKEDVWKKVEEEMQELHEAVAENDTKHIEEELKNNSYLLHESIPKDIDHTKTIHMDAMGFGMGMSCLQVTFQASKLSEARSVYDQLAVFAPIMLALTAATPFYRGRIVHRDLFFR